MRRIRAALAAWTPGGVRFPPCPWRIHGESSSWDFNHRQFNLYHDAPWGRNFWVLTAYAVSGLAVFGVLIYYVSAYITQ